MAVMNTRPTESSMTSVPAAANTSMTSGVVGMKPGISPTQLPSPHHHSGIGMKPGPQTPPANVLQVVKQVQEEAARQQAPHGYGKVNPANVIGGVAVGVGVAGQPGPGVMPPPQMQMQRPVQINNPGLMSMDQWQG